MNEPTSLIVKLIEGNAKALAKLDIVVDRIVSLEAHQLLMAKVGVIAIVIFAIALIRPKDYGKFVRMLTRSTGVLAKFVLVLMVILFVGLLGVNIIRPEACDQIFQMLK